MNWDKKWLVDLNAGKTQLVSFDRSNNTGAIAGLQDCWSFTCCLSRTFSSLSKYSQ